MKRKLSAVALLAVLLVAASANAQFREDTTLLTIGYGASFTKADESDDSLTGNAAGFTLERVLSGGKFNVGIMLYWLWLDDDVKLEGEDSTTPYSYSGVPFMFTGRYNFLASRFSANIGLGIGFHTSTRYINEGTTEEQKSTTSGVAFAVPVELAYFLDPDLFLQLTYSPSWMRSTPLRNDFAQSVALSLGFVWGGDD